eukprot:CAMPEP_0184871810 /NCGR_PEP_ID=MMETSP0580-20130426/40933_1 /TAXON_ID=1118495 /ORGANISM="Dactyliosolen fragilissimus" /LENGTH=109 /DNA_ID=CAMNT_0027374521 /DNA_START=838 /DNA_END=1170 /DNA_ORIENTATION=-
MTVPPKLTFINAQETLITVEFTFNPSIESYVLNWKEYAQSWENSSYKVVPNVQNSSGPVQVDTFADLNPGTPYCLRLTVGEGGVPGPEIIVDTEAVSCAPKRQACCVIN